METEKREVSGFEIEADPVEPGGRPRVVLASMLIRNQAFRLLQEAFRDRQWNDARELIDLNQMLGTI